MPRTVRQVSEGQTEGGTAVAEQPDAGAEEKRAALESEIADLENQKAQVLAELEEAKARSVEAKQAELARIEEAQRAKAAEAKKYAPPKELSPEEHQKALLHDAGTGEIEEELARRRREDLSSVPTDVLQQELVRRRG